MMRAFAFLLVFLLLGFALQWISPWWTHLLAALLAAFFFLASERRAFSLGLLAGALLWGGLALYLDLRNTGILSRKMGQLLGDVNRPALLALTAAAGGLLAGLAAWFGAVLRRVLWPVR